MAVSTLGAMCPQSEWSVLELIRLLPKCRSLLATPQSNMDFQSHPQTRKHALDGSPPGNDRALAVNKRAEAAAMLDREESDHRSTPSDDDEEAGTRQVRAGQVSSSLQFPDAWTEVVFTVTARPSITRWSRLSAPRLVARTLSTIAMRPSKLILLTVLDLSEHFLNLEAHTNAEAKTYAEDSIWQSLRIIKAEDELRKDQDAKTRCDRCSRCGSVRECMVELGIVFTTPPPKRKASVGRRLV
ncbi:hypothetical protein LTR10_014968 [Elasticomyces elasticus]|nr:hypothetical protein LTR10_014968 [Elasticomyces elasticus]